MSKFKIGDKVRRTGPTTNFITHGKEHTVTKVSHNGSITLTPSSAATFNPELFELVVSPPTLPNPTVDKQMVLPSDAIERKGLPITTGVLDYFPLALAAVAQVSKAGNDQHNPGQPLHWARGKSTDHHDCIARHLIDRGTLDTDGQRHSAKLAWRALAALQVELEQERGLFLDAK